MPVSWKLSLRAVHIDEELIERTAKNTVAFGTLCGNVWEHNGIKLDTFMKVNNGVVLPIISYAYECLG